MVDVATEHGRMPGNRGIRGGKQKEAAIPWFLRRGWLSLNELSTAESLINIDGGRGGGSSRSGGCAVCLR